MRAALVLATALLAGCLAAPQAEQTLDPAALEALLSQPLLEKVLKENVRVASYDAVEIDNWVYRPETDAPVPVIVNFSPYWGNVGGDPAEGGDAFSKYLVEYFVPRGYAVVLSSARGTGASDGCFTIGGPGELEDMRRVVDRFAEAPWSTGVVGAGGKSYDGTMPQGLAVTGHPALKAIFPVSPISEFYKYNYNNGVPYEHTGVWFNTYYVLGVGWGEYNGVPSPSPDDLTCPDNPDVQRAQYESLVTGDYTPYWQDRNYTAMAGNLRDDLGVFYVHGFEDWNVKPDHMTPWFDALAERGLFVKKWLGQWEHDYPHRGDMNLTLLRFFDHYLKGVDTGLLAEPRVQVQASDGTWRHEDDWPPARAEPVAFYPSEGGSLADAPGSGTASFLDAGARPPTGPHVAFLTEPLEAPLHYAGVPHVSFEVSHTAAKGAVAATLYAVDGDAWTPINQGFLDLRHRNSLERGEPVVPGERFRVSFGMFPQDDVVPAGQRLALVVSATSPEGAPVTVVPAPSGGLTTLHLGAGTSITLPVVAPDPARVEDPQPEDLGCWAC